MREVSFLDALAEAQLEEMKNNENVVVMGQDLHASLYGGVGLLEAFGPERVRNLPTSETGCVGVAIGMAATGMRPVIDMGMSSFCFVAFDQLVSQLAKIRYVTGGLLKAPVVVRIPFMFDNAVGVQHSDRIHPMLMQIPGLKIVCPTTPQDAKDCLRASIRDDDPVVFVEDSFCWGMKGPIEDGAAQRPVEGAAVRREGSDVTIVAIGRTCTFSLEAAAHLEEEEGISAEVVDLRWLAPIDWGMILRSVEKTGRVVAVDPAAGICSAASEIAATVAEELGEGLRAPVRRVTSPQVHSPYAAGLERLIYPDEHRIRQAALQSVRGR